MSTDISDCIAMSEDGDWYAYPKTMTRGQVMSTTARQLDDIGYGDWHWTLKHYTVRAGHIHEDVRDKGYWHEVTDGVVCSRCVPCWIVRRKP